MIRLVTGYYSEKEKSDILNQKKNFLNLRTLITVTKYIY